MKSPITKTLICPHCGHSTIEWCDTTDSGAGLIDGKEGLIEFCEGYCTHCGKNVEWEQCYILVGYRNERAWDDE